MMMRRRKDEAKVMSPMFPRLHVNDTEKGGPKAPPRNKMALYEQLSIPSQRFNSALPLPPNKTNSLVPSISSRHGEGNESSMFMPFENSREPSSLAEKFHSYSIHGAKISSTKENQHNQFPKATDYHSLDTTPSTPAVCKSTFLSPHFSNLKKFSPRKLGHDDDLRVPTSVLSGIDRSCSCNKHGEDQECFPELNLSSSMQLQSANEISVGSKSKRYVENQAEENGRLFRSNQDLADTSSNLSTKMKNSKSLKRPHNSCNKENKISSVDILNGEVHANTWLHHESGRSLENASTVRNKSCSRQSLGVDNGSLNALETRYKTHEENNPGTPQVRGLNRHNKVPSTSMMESVSFLNMCPDDIVGIIGQKHFWKVRRAIIDGSSSPWGFSPPGSQWLVPVMSPSEGLVYKPYAGPCPPTAGILAPVYGSCGPLNLATGGGDFLSSTYGVSASYQQGFGILPGNPPIGQTYFPHYGTPVRNPSVSGSVVEQMSPFTGVKSMGNRLSTGDVNFTIAQQSSCNMSSQMSQAISFCVTKLPASKFNSNSDLYTSQSADWRDSLRLTSFESNPDSSDLPPVYREPTMEYNKHINILAETLFELLSEGLGLQPDHLSSMGCNKGCSIVSHYYPPCPEPELTLGLRKHADAGIMALLLQNHVTGLQVLHDDQWFDVHPARGGLVVNIGDLLQILSNDKFKSVKHRVTANRVGPRISVVCFFSGHADMLEEPFGTIKELISETNPPRYKEFVLKEYIDKVLSSPIDSKPAIDYYKL